MKAAAMIRGACSQSIQDQFWMTGTDSTARAEMKTAKQLWKYLHNSFDDKSHNQSFDIVARWLKVTFPANSNPGPAIEQCGALYEEMLTHNLTRDEFIY